MIKADERAFLRAAMRKQLISASEVTEAVSIKEKTDSGDPIHKILIKMGALDVQAARRLQAELQGARKARRRRRRADDASSSLSSGKTKHIGPYVVESFLGAGAMGSVYVARHGDLNRKVALKVLSAEQPTQRQVDRFKREARLTASLDHPNIVRVFDGGMADGRHFIAMDLIEGAPLDEALSAGSVDFEQMAYIVQKTAEALHYAHERGVIHRDVKPSNILLEKSGEPKVTDFGLAVFTERDSVRLTKTGAAVGTPAYMAPEQVLGDSDRVGGHTDVYGLGATMYEMLTGRPPFRGHTFLELANNIVSKEPPSISEFTPEVPEKLEIICMKALEKDLDMRYADGAALAADLASFLHKEPIKATRPSLVQQSKKWVRRHRSLAMGLLAALVVATFSLVYYFQLPGHLVLDTVPSNATVILGGREYKTPLDDRNFPPGVYELSFRHPGFEPTIPGVPRLEVARNAKTRVTFNLFSTRGTLVVHSKPSGARVEVLAMSEGGERVIRDGTTSFVEQLPAGQYDVKVSLPGHAPRRLTNVVVSKGNQVKELPVVKLEPDEGFLTLQSDPGDVQVELETPGLPRRVMLGPFEKTRVGSGATRVTVRKSGYLTRRLTTRVQREQESRLAVTLPILSQHVRRLPGRITAAPLFGDVDGDGLDDLLVLTRPERSARPLLSILGRGGSGELIWDHSTEATRLLGLVDANLDDSLDVVTGGPLEIECRDGREGQRLWRRRISGEFAILDPGRNRPTGPRVLALDNSGRLVAVDAATGVLTGVASLRGEPTMAPRLLDIEQDGNMEIVVAVARGFDNKAALVVMDLAGEVRFEWAAPSIIRGVATGRFREDLAGGIAVLVERGPIEVLDSAGATLFRHGDPESSFDMLATGRVTGQPFDDLLVSDGDRVTLVTGRRGSKVWSRPGRYGLLLPAEADDKPARVWVDGRLLSERSGEPVWGAAAEPWIGRNRPFGTADIDHDGRPEVLAAGRDGRSLIGLACHDPGLLFLAPVRGVRDLSVSPSGRVTAVIEPGQSVALINDSGRLLWRKGFGSVLRDVVTPGDLEGDGREDVLVVGKTFVMALSGVDGRTLWEHRGRVSGVASTAEDADGDGRPDVLTSGPSLLLSGSNGAPIVALDAKSPRGGPEAFMPSIHSGAEPRFLAQTAEPGIALFSRAGRRLSGLRRSFDLAAPIAEDPTRAPVLVLARGDTVSAVDLGDGVARWTARTSGSVEQLLVLQDESMGRNLVAFKTRLGLVEVHDAGTGRRLWRRALPGDGYRRGVDTGSNLVGFTRDGKLYLTWVSERGETLVVDGADGRLMWSRLEPDGIEDPKIAVWMRPQGGPPALLFGRRSGALEARIVRVDARSSTRPEREILSRLTGVFRRLDKSDVASLQTGYEQLAGANATWPAAHTGYGEILLALGRAADAEKRAEQALRIVAQAPAGEKRFNIAANRLLALARARQGQVDGAVAVVDRVAGESRSVAGELATSVGDVLLELGEDAAAWRLFDRAVTALPRLAEARRGRALTGVVMTPLDSARLEEIDDDLKFALLDFPTDGRLRALAALTAISRLDHGAALSHLASPALERTEQPPGTLETIKIIREIALLMKAGKTSFARRKLSSLVARKSTRRLAPLANVINKKLK